MKSKRASACIGIAVVLLVGAISFGCGSSSHIIGAPHFFLALDDASGTPLKNVNVYSVNPVSGALTLATASAQDIGLDDPSAAVINPKLPVVYFADWYGNIVSASIDASGRLTQIGTTYNTGYNDFGWVGGLAVTADGKYLYATTDDAYVVAFAINQTNGTLTHIASDYDTGLTWTGDITIVGNNLYVTEWETSSYIRVATINSDGHLTDNGDLFTSDGDAIWTVQADQSGKWLVIGDEYHNLYVYGIKADGTLQTPAVSSLTYYNDTEAPGCNGFGDVRSIAFTHDNKFFYTTDDCNAVHTLPFNASTGAIGTELTPPVPNQAIDCKVVVDPSDSFVYAASGDLYGFKRDKTTGALTQLTGMPTTEQGYPCGLTIF